MFHIACSVSVKFNQATGYVTEGETYEGIITLNELAYHNFSFNVAVSTRSGSAHGICHLYTNLLYFSVTSKKIT